VLRTDYSKLTRSFLSFLVVNIQRHVSILFPPESNLIFPKYRNTLFSNNLCPAGLYKGGFYDSQIS
jgi:hypothetical protein